MTEQRAFSETEHATPPSRWRRYVPLLLVFGGIAVFSAGFWMVAIGSIGVIVAGSDSAFRSAAMLGLPVMLAGLAVVASGDLLERVLRR